MMRMRMMRTKMMKKKKKNPQKELRKRLLKNLPPSLLRNPRNDQDQIDSIPFKLIRIQL